MRITLKPLLHCQRQSIHASAHIRHTTCNPHLRSSRKRDHDRTIKPLSSCAAASMSKPDGIATRHRFPRSIVMTGACGAGAVSVPSEASSIFITRKIAGQNQAIHSYGDNANHKAETAIPHGVVLPPPLSRRRQSFPQRYGFFRHQTNAGGGRYQRLTKLECGGCLRVRP